MRLTVLLLVWVVACQNEPEKVAASAAVSRSALDCGVAIVGGGAAGLHTAYRLAADYGSRVCLFEKESYLGGRIHDLSRNEGGPYIGTGARRIMEGQSVVFALADELGITYESVPWQDDLINARGFAAYNSDDLNAQAYPLVDNATGESALYDQLRHGPERAHADAYPDFRAYARAVIGAQAYQFLRDVSRFRADFEYPLDARGYLDYLDEEWDVCCTPSYPIGGMSEFIRRMEAASLAHGVQIFKSEPALQINRGSGGYVITTPSYTASAAQLVLAVDANNLKHIQGDVISGITAQPEFAQLIGVKVATITQWWPSRWWEGLNGKQTHRAWTTESCINHIEIPVDAYGIAQNVTRSVYDDDLNCVMFWEEAQKQGEAHVNAEIKRGLQQLFPGATIPDALKTHVQIWPAAWYWLRAGSPYTNADIAQWAIEPLTGESVSLVGESYNPQRSGWSDAAYKSSIATLDAKFGFHLSGAANAHALMRARPQRAGLAQAGH